MTTTPSIPKPMNPRERAIASTAFKLWELAGSHKDDPRRDEFWNAAVLIVDEIRLTCAIKIRTYEVAHA